MPAIRRLQDETTDLGRARFVEVEFGDDVTFAALQTLAEELFAVEFERNCGATRAAHFRDELRGAEHGTGLGVLEREHE